MDELRYVRFYQQQKRENEVLTPTSDSLRQHVYHASYLYLEELTTSNAGSAKSRRPWMGERRWLSKTSLYDEGSCST